MPRKIHHRAPNEHAIKTGQLAKQLAMQHPHMNHREIFAKASKMAAGKTHKGYGLSFAPYGSGMHLKPHH